MVEHLVWTIAGPMGSFGESARAERRRTSLMPPKSALVGMVAAALGIERGDDDAHEALNRYGFAVQRLGECSPLRDYHTVQCVPESITGTATRGGAIAAAGRRVHTLVTIRDYRTDIAMRATMWAESPRWTLVEIARALRAPAFPLCIGRRCCPLASPTCPLVVRARTPLQALAESAAPIWMPSARPGLVCSDPFPRRQPRPRGAAVERGAEQSAVALFQPGGVVLRHVVTAMTYLTRARLNRRASSGALASLLCPRDADTALDVHHRLIWSLFPARKCARDFLWRATRRTEFLVLSRRRPCENELFEPLQVKTFAPVLEVGDRLRFTLRVNATKHRLAPRRGRIGPAGYRTDIVTDALLRLREHRRHVDERGHVPRTERRATEKAVAAEWLARQGEKSGFAVENIGVESHLRRHLRRPGGRDATIGILDLTGTVRLTDVEAFTARLHHGFGRARAFGCGLMLIRPA